MHISLGNGILCCRNITDEQPTRRGAVALPNCNLYYSLYPPEKA